MTEYVTATVMLHA